MFYESMLQGILMGSAYEIIGDYVPNVQLRFLHNHRVIQFVEFLRRYMNMKSKIHGFLGVCEYVRWRVYILCTAGRELDGTQVESAGRRAPAACRPHWAPPTSLLLTFEKKPSS